MNKPYEDIEDKQLYLSKVAPVFFLKALFSDTTENYINPVEPNPYGNVRIRFRTAINNVDYVYLMTKDEMYPMKVEFSDTFFDFYSVSVMLNAEPFEYYFKVKSGNVTCLYDRNGVIKEGSPITMFRIIPDFHTPVWAKGAVMYQIYTERFCNGDPTNDVESGEYYYVGGLVNKVDDWYKTPAVDGTKEFYGGDLQGVINKLPYLKDLGVDCIYFNPLFVSPSNHKYDSQDYEHIDPHFGVIVKDGGECLKDGDSDNRNATKYQIRVCSEENLTASDKLFCDLVSKAHELGIRVILDGVFNHCGSFNKWLDRERIYENKEGYFPGAYVAKESPYHNYFDFRGSDNWPYNGNYDGWWGFDTLPKLNYEVSYELYDKIIDIAKKWIMPPFNADGWRLDVAADLGHSSTFNHDFYKRLRRAIKDVKPEALILAEHYGDPESWLRGDEWDSVMNYDGFMEPVTWFLTGMQKHSDDFRQDMLGNADAFFAAMQYAGYKFTNPSQLVSMNQLSNHDHSRFLTRTNQRVGRINTLGSEAASIGVNKAVMRLAVVIQMTWPGAPTIYYGDEVGLTGFTDPDNRRTFPWGREDSELLEFHKIMIRIHKNNRELITGSLKKLLAEPYIISYARFTRSEASYIVINRNTERRVVDIPAWEAVSVTGEGLERILLSDENGYNTDKVILNSKGGKLRLEMPPLSAAVIRTRGPRKV